MRASKSLIGRDRICAFLEIDKNVFYQLVQEGLPVVKRGGRWIGHEEVLDEYFRSVVMTQGDDERERPG